MHCHLPAATHNVRSHWISPADGPASPSCTRAMPQAVAVAYTASTLGAAARCSKSTSFLPLMPLSRLVARHSRMLSRSYGGRVCGAVACVWPVLTRLLSVPCLGHKNRTRGAAQGPSKPRNRQMSQPGSPRAGPSQKERKKTDTPNEGWDEDRVPTCTSRILEGRSGGQVGLSCS